MGAILITTIVMCLVLGIILTGIFSDADNKDKNDFNNDFSL